MKRPVALPPRPFTCAMARGLQPRGLTRQPADVGALDAKIVELAGRKALQLADRIPITPPAAVAGIEVADILRHCFVLSAPASSGRPPHAVTRTHIGAKAAIVHCNKRMAGLRAAGESL